MTATTGHPGQDSHDGASGTPSAETEQIGPGPLEDESKDRIPWAGILEITVLGQDSQGKTARTE